MLEQAFKAYDHLVVGDGRTVRTLEYILGNGETNLQVGDLFPMSLGKNYVIFLEVYSTDI